MQSQNYKFLFWANKAADLVLLSVLWLLCSLPVFTVGASTSALYYAVMKSVREDQEYAVSAFGKSLKQNLRQNLFFYLGSMVFLMAFCTTVYKIYHSQRNFGMNVVMVFFCFCAVINVLLQLHACFLVGRYAINGKAFWSVLIRLTGCRVWMNLLMLLTVVFAVELILWYPMFLLIVPGGLVYVLSYMEEKRFQTLL